ncbi:hypothetical protein GMMP15_70004 [Candidatus Magnetomoraceae bacterium gMMP-15]
MDLIIINKLDEVYIDARYPVDLGLLSYGKPTIEDAKQFYEFAEYIKINIDNYLKFKNNS